MKRAIARRAALLALALWLALMPPAAVAEEDVLSEQVDEAPGEAEEFDLAGPEPAPAAAPEATVAPTPQPGIRYCTSWNYPEDRVVFDGEIWDILTGAWGLADFQAAALMGSLYAESGLSPYNVQDTGGLDDRGRYAYRAGDGVGFGLCQWTSSGRKAALLRYAEAHGDPDLVWDFDIQMGYLRQEIDLDALRRAESLYEAAEWVVLVYERPSLSHVNSWPGTRYEYARRIYRAHTGRRYAEPPLRFSVARDGLSLPESGSVALECGLLPEPAGVLTVSSNYYWRLTLAEETEPGWLEVLCPNAYHPDRLEPCACGYARDGEKPLTLRVRRLPPPGETWSAALRFEIFRGRHVARTATVALTRRAPDPARLADAAARWAEFLSVLAMRTGLIG